MNDPDPATDPSRDAHKEGDADKAGHDAGTAVGEGLQHLEAAARELVEAGRSFLDAVEVAIGRPGGVDAFLRDLAGRSGSSASDQEPDEPYEEIPVD